METLATKEPISIGSNIKIDKDIDYKDCQGNHKTLKSGREAVIKFIYDDKIVADTDGYLFILER